MPFETSASTCETITHVLGPGLGRDLGEVDTHVFLADPTSAFNRDPERPVVIHSWPNVEATHSMRGPRSSVAGVLENDDLGSHWSDGSSHPSECKDLRLPWGRGRGRLVLEESEGGLQAL
jgi:hypothetical protein